MLEVGVFWKSYYRVNKQSNIEQRVDITATPKCKLKINIQIDFLNLATKPSQEHFYALMFAPKNVHLTSTRELLQKDERLHAHTHLKSNAIWDHDRLIIHNRMEIKAIFMH